MKIFNAEFEGVISGDHECFCFDVPLSDFVKIIGRTPERFDKSSFNLGLYKIYPSDIIKLEDRTGPYKFKINIEAKELTDEEKTKKAF